MKSKNAFSSTLYFDSLRCAAGTTSPKALATKIAFVLVLTTGVCWAQSPVCIPGTQFCAGVNGNGRVQANGTAQGSVSPNGATGNANANANTNVNASSNVNASASGNGNVSVSEYGNGSGNGGSLGEQSNHYSHYEPIRFGAGLLLCGTLKAGVFAGIKAGPCFAVSFRTERLTFEMETQLLFGGVRHSVDWVFPMSFVIPLTNQRSLYEGLQLRFGGSPIGVTFARSRDGGNFVRFGLHAGISYELGINTALSLRVFDIRTYLDFGTRRQVDLRDNFLDFGGQLATGIVF